MRFKSIYAYYAFYVYIMYYYTYILLFFKIYTYLLFTLFTSTLSLTAVDLKRKPALFIIVYHCLRFKSNQKKSASWGAKF